MAFSSQILGFLSRTSRPISQSCETILERLMSSYKKVVGQLFQKFQFLLSKNELKVSPKVAAVLLRRIGSWLSAKPPLGSLEGASGPRSGSFQQEISLSIYFLYHKLFKKLRTNKWLKFIYKKIFMQFSLPDNFSLN